MVNALLYYSRKEVMSLTVQPGWTFAAAAIELGVTRGRVSQLVKAGKLSTITVHGRAYISQTGLDAYREQLRQERMAKEVCRVGV